jgi:hypothetical protein
MMAQSKSGGTESNKQSETPARVGGKDADKKSSKNHMADVKAGTGKGAGGGAKQKQKR